MQRADTQNPPLTHGGRTCTAKVRPAGPHDLETRVKGKGEGPGAGQWAEASAGRGMGRGDGVRREVKMAHKDLNESFWRKENGEGIEGRGGGEVEGYPEKRSTFPFSVIVCQTSESYF